jgi:hypothetical protein
MKTTRDPKLLLLSAAALALAIAALLALLP